MGAGVSNWRLARAVAMLGQLGTVSGTALDLIMARRLQDGDKDGQMRHALEHFPLKQMAQSIIDEYFIPGGKQPDAPYKPVPMHSKDGPRRARELCIAANFVEVFLAREGHDGCVGINYLEKIQFPHLPSLYGAMLAGVTVVIMGAGIPREIPSVIASFAQHQAATYPLRVAGPQSGEEVRMSFDPSEYLGEDLPDLRKPAFLPIVSSSVLAQVMARKTVGAIDGFIVEGPTAGGHNAPPRGTMKLTPDGQPIYGERDVVDLAEMRALGKPFWLAGGYGTPGKLGEALAAGAAGIQVGTVFAFCAESGLDDSFKRALLDKALRCQASVFTDPVASPTGFPFKVAQLEGTASEKADYLARLRLCDLGYMRELYRRSDGTLGYRCPAEPVEQYVAKEGRREDTVGRKCLCNTLMANIGMAQRVKGGGIEQALITTGDDLVHLDRFASLAHPDYSAADVVRILLADAKAAANG